VAELEPEDDDELEDELLDDPQAVTTTANRTAVSAPRTRAT
jgi:hypothetical protein